jgi:hypothetical protein
MKKTSSFSQATRKPVIIKGRGTANEQRIETDIDLYFVPSLGKWCTIPERN